MKMANNNSSNHQSSPDGAARKLPDLRGLIDNEDMADVTFVFTQEDSNQDQQKKESVERIHANKCILATQSPVFKAMLYGKMKEKKEIIITDISAETFLAMLRHVYTGEIALNPRNILDLFYAAEKYMFDPFLKLVEQELVKTLSIENVLKVFEVLERFPKSEVLKDVCLFIKQNTLLILQHESFTQTRRSVVNWILSQPKLNAAEIQLFDAGFRWAKAECARNGIENAKPEELRKTLGEELFLIRIPTMSPRHFMKGPAASGIFSLKESNEIVDYIVASTKTNSTKDFVSRFELEGRKQMTYFTFHYDKKVNFISLSSSPIEITTTLNFESSSDILLTGFCLCPIIDTFTIASVVLLEGLSSVFYEEKMNLNQLYGREGNKSSSYSFNWATPILISANLAYKLSVTLGFAEVQDTIYKLNTEKFTVKYEREFFENPISLEMSTTSPSNIRIYALYIH